MTEKLGMNMIWGIEQDQIPELPWLSKEGNSLSVSPNYVTWKKDKEFLRGFSLMDHYFTFLFPSGCWMEE